MNERNKVNPLRSRRLTSNGMNRRQFLKRTTSAAVAVVGFPYIIRSSALGKADSVAPSNRIIMGCIGMGIQGTANMEAFLVQKDVQVVAVCDVRGSQRRKARNIVDQYYGNKGCATYNDFRELIARKDIDAVSIAPPDQWHVLIGLEAARAGKDMYYEKPVGLSLSADKTLRNVVNRYGVVFQLGTQQRSDSSFRFACELVRNGRIGKLHTILVGVPGSISFPNQPTEPVPDDIDYNMWLGPAPWAPYSYERCRPYVDRENAPWYHCYSVWYHIYDYCLGFVANWGIHHVNTAQWGNGTDQTGPVEIEGTGTFPEDGLADCATNWKVEHKFANGVKMIHMDNSTSAAHPLQIPGFSQGVLFLGTDGWVFINRDRIEARPKSLLKSVIRPNEIHLARSKNHHRNFLNAVKTRHQTICPVEQAVRSDTICHLSDIAIRLARKLRWNSEKEEFIADAQANSMLTRAMRSPWHL